MERRALVESLILSALPGNLMSLLPFDIWFCCYLLFFSYYCSCLKKGWRKHSILHHTDYKVIQDDCVDKREIDYDWTFLSESPTYTPTAMDVGCILRVEVLALATSSAEDNSVLCGPFNHYTEGVLAAPKAPPSRPLVSGNKSILSSNSHVQFKLVSYNILAELYATKSVSKLFVSLRLCPLRDFICLCIQCYSNTLTVIVGLWHGNIVCVFFCKRYVMFKVILYAYRKYRQTILNQISFRS